MRSSSWEQLSEALQRVMATGVTERKAKRDICQAIANQKIGLRFYFMMRPTRMDFLTGRDIPTSLVHRVKGDDIPPILKPGDFDWPRSKVRKTELWVNIRGPSGSFFGNWRVNEIARYNAAEALPHSERGGRSLAYQHRVELQSADVTNVLSGGQMVHDEQVSAITNLQSGGAKTRGIREAIIEIWPDGIPKGLSGKDRNNAIIQGLKRNGSSVPKNPERAIQRVLKAQRPK